eukprot:NODE_830_length_3646_cov_0.455314.p3 type:complete len:111 gc:universal NODE_830_length_3646_cov_0.455314:602-270(-)
MTCLQITMKFKFVIYQSNNCMSLHSFIKGKHSPYAMIYMLSMMTFANPLSTVAQPDISKFTDCLKAPACTKISPNHKDFDPSCKGTTALICSTKYRNMANFYSVILIWLF